jgi:hypothetical protein
VAGRSVENRRGYRDRVVFTPCQQRGVVGQLSGVDFARSNSTEELVRPSELFPLAVLAAWKLDTGPDPVLFVVLNSEVGAAPLLRHRAPA